MPKRFALSAGDDVKCGGVPYRFSFRNVRCFMAASVPGVKDDFSRVASIVRGC